jgi:hypothetical protein
MQVKLINISFVIKFKMKNIDRDATAGRGDIGILMESVEIFCKKCFLFKKIFIYLLIQS